MGSFFIVKYAEGISRYIEKLQSLLMKKGIECEFSAPTYNFYSRSIYPRSFLSFTRHLKNMVNSDITHLHFPITSLIIPFKRTLRNLKPVVVQIWNHPYISRNVFDLWHRIVNSATLTALALKGFNSPIIVSSLHLQRTLKAMGGNNVNYIPAGVDVESFPFFPSPTKTEDDQFNILYYGHLTKWKGVNNLIEAISTVVKEEPSTKLKIVWTGYGGSYMKTMNLVRQLGLQKHVVIRRSICKDVPSLLAHCDIGILPLLSPIATASPPRTLLEMMSVGLPVVATRIGGVSEIITHGKTGILTDVSPESIAEGILSLLSNETLIQEIRFAARRYVVENHDWQKVLPLYVKFYEENL